VARCAFQTFVFKKDDILNIYISNEYIPKVNRIIGVPDRSKDRVVIITKSKSYLLLVQNGKKFIQECVNKLNIPHEGGN
jgi:hypothetical protein